MDGQRLPKDDVTRPYVIDDLLDNTLAHEFLSIRDCCNLKGIEANKG